MSYASVGFDNSYLNIYITLDPQIDLYQRTVYSFLDMFGYIGGIFGLLKALGYFTVSFFIKRDYYSSILSKLYHIQDDHSIDKSKNAEKNNKVEDDLKFKRSPINFKHLKTSNIRTEIELDRTPNSFKDKKKFIQEDVKYEENNDSNDKT